MQHHVTRRVVTTAAAFLLGLGMAAAGLGGPGLLPGMTPPAHAGSGGGSGQTRYVLQFSEHTVLAAFQTTASDGCTVTEVSITAGEDVTRLLPAPSTTFGPAALAVVTRWNACTEETYFAGAGMTEVVTLSIATSLQSASLSATIPITPFDAPPGSPPAFSVVVPDLTFAATGPAVHTVQTSHFNMHEANLVQRLNGARTPATTAGTVTVGSYATVSTANLLNGEIDDYHAGTTSVSKG
jgi:hypothetical protein